MALRDLSEVSKWWSKIFWIQSHLYYTIIILLVIINRLYNFVYYSVKILIEKIHNCTMFTYTFFSFRGSKYNDLPKVPI